MVRRERSVRVECVCRKREHPPTQPQALTQNASETLPPLQGRVGASTQGLLGGGARTSARASACALARVLPAQTCVCRTRCESATRRRGLPQSCGSASGRTRSASARATRTTRLARKARSLPCLSAQDRARSSLPPAIGTKATRRPGAAGRCGSQRWPWCGGWARKEAQKSCKISKCPGLRRSPWQWHEPAGPKGDRNDAHA